MSASTLSEADLRNLNAILQALKPYLKRNDEDLLASLLLRGFFDVDLERPLQQQPDALLREAKDAIDGALKVLDSLDA
ncbi:hypothetical protein [Bradyrhizobium sp. CCBAU 25338]|uniref:hypothetical protein n=1 Tax=Bradyrhizobium sp. CCBAU 25338 TaxID=1641877 RepID=UPI002302CB5C|nr:hypothetical protein [Bradyrhizobium sp. CCBAU 25338]MDA9529890.1 hypothetical protein [Bradyrhizobium sp. CCBAU 25338]